MIKHTPMCELLKTHTIDEAIEIINAEIDANSKYRKKLNSIQNGDLVKLGSKEAVVIELTDDKYVQVQFIGLPHKAYVERKIIVDDKS